MQLTIRGNVTERQELLNGTQTVTLAGASARWEMWGELSWNLGLVDYAGEGDITLCDSRGSLYATAVRVEVAPDDETEAAGEGFRVEYGIDGGEGAYEGAEGTASGAGRISGGEFEGVWTLELTSGEPEAGMA